MKIENTYDSDNKESSKNVEKYYDLIIKINSIKSLFHKTEGWKIKFNDNYESIKENLQNNKGRLKVGILGNENVGKSFLL